MRRTYLFLGVSAVLIAGGLIVWLTSPSTAQQPDDRKPDTLDARGPGAVPVKAAKNDQSPSVTLPLTSVVLFNSGVGYFQREGTVEGDARVDMQFRVTDVNDLLKSLVLEDLDGGKITAVSYDSQEPVEKTLKSFALDLTYNPTVGQLLNQARGEKIEVTLQQAAAGQPANITGVVMGMEAKATPHGKDQVIESDILNVLCTEGVRSVPLNQVLRFRFLNPTLESEFRRALEVLASSHDSMKKMVSLNFKGEGKRRVRIGYVVENPMWKASYRLVMNGEKKGPALQGWAMVENTSDEDWKDVKVALISGRPISFQMNLYQPLFIPRPTVEPERFASLRPPTYSGAIMTNPMGQPPGDAIGQQGLGQFGQLGGQFGQFGQLGQLGQIGNLGFQGGGFQGMNPMFNRYQMGNSANFNNLALGIGNIDNNANLADPNQANLQGKLNWDQYQQRRNDRRNQARNVGSAVAALDPSGSVGSLATAEEIGDYFQYTIDDKITLPRQKSTMLPVINKGVESKRVSIFNESVHSKFPLLGLRFKNTTNQNLMQGPVAIFDGGTYAGDARVPDMQPNEERLLSYAIDLGSEVKVTMPGGTEQLVKVKITKGVVQTSHKLRETKVYTLVNRSPNDRVMIVEHPFREDWKVVEPAKASERSRDVHRFELAVDAGKTVEHKVIEEQTRGQSIALTNTDDRTIKIFLSSQVTSEKVKAAMTRAVEMRAAAATTKRDLAEQNLLLKGITDDQTRLRANLDKLPPTSAAYKRYLEKFDKQETEIEKLQAAIATLQEQDKKHQQEYQDYLVTLTVE